MPDKLIAPRRNEVLTGNGIGTIRFMEYLERVADATNTTQSAVDAQIVQNLSAVVFDLQSKVGSGELLTSDCDSLTVDSTVLFVDQTEA